MKTINEFFNLTHNDKNFKQLGKQLVPHELFSDTQHVQELIGHSDFHPENIVKGGDSDFLKYRRDIYGKLRSSKYREVYENGAIKDDHERARANMETLADLHKSVIRHSNGKLEDYLPKGREPKSPRELVALAHWAHENNGEIEFFGGKRKNERPKTQEIDPRIKDLPIRLRALETLKYAAGVINRQKSETPTTTPSESDGEVTKKVGKLEAEREKIVTSADLDHKLNFFANSETVRDILTNKDSPLHPENIFVNSGKEGFIRDRNVYGEIHQKSLSQFEEDNNLGSSKTERAKSNVETLAHLHGVAAKYSAKYDGKYGNLIIANHKNDPTTHGEHISLASKIHRQLNPGDVVKSETVEPDINEKRPEAPVETNPNKIMWDKHTAYLRNREKGQRIREKEISEIKRRVREILGIPKPVDHVDIENAVSMTLGEIPPTESKRAAAKTLAAIGTDDLKSKRDPREEVPLNVDRDIENHVRRFLGLKENNINFISFKKFLFENDNVIVLPTKPKPPTNDNSQEPIFPKQEYSDTDSLLSFYYGRGKAPITHGYHVSNLIAAVDNMEKTFDRSNIFGLQDINYEPAKRYERIRDTIKSNSEIELNELKKYNTPNINKLLNTVHELRSFSEASDIIRERNNINNNFEFNEFQNLLRDGEFHARSHKVYVDGLKALKSEHGFEPGKNDELQKAEHIRTISNIAAKHYDNSFSTVGIRGAEIIDHVMGK